MNVLIVSLNAGGGHQAAMHSLALALQQFTPEVKVTSFTSPSRTLEHLHRLAYTRGATLYNTFYQATAHSTVLRRTYFAMAYPGIRSFSRELAPLLHACEVVISTHFMQTYALLSLRQRYGLRTKIIAYVPDCDPSGIHVPRYAGRGVDAVIAQGPGLLAHLAQISELAPERLQRGGFLPRTTFTAVRALSPVQARQRLAALDLPLVSRLRPEAFTVVVTGGAYWTMGLYDVLKHLASYPVAGGTPAFARPSNQILIVCGHNIRAYSSYKHLHQTTGLNIVPLPFLSAEQLAMVFRSADVTVLGSVAPATFYELLEAQAGPLLVHRLNPGPEPYNLAFLLQQHLAYYLPRPQDLLQTLLRLSASPAVRARWQQRFRQAAARERQAARARARHNAELIVQVAAQPVAVPPQARSAVSTLSRA